MVRPKKLTAKEYRAIGKRKELSPETMKKYIKFMTKAFPDERYQSYASEWATRFASGRPEIYMDKENKEIYWSL